VRPHLVSRGKTALDFVSALATFASRALNSGRRVCGHERKKDVHSPVARRLRGFTVCRLPYFTTLDGNPLEEALQDNTVSLMPEQVAFKSIFPAWRLSKTERDRRLIDLLMLGERTRDVGRLFCLSDDPISQKRCLFREDWARFRGEAG
jgi:hypothetical protein